MASFSVPTICATPFSKSLLTAKKQALVHKTSQLSFYKSHPKSTIVSCKEKDETQGHPNDKSATNIISSAKVIDRRNMLMMGLGGAAATATATLGAPALALNLPQRKGPSQPDVSNGTDFPTSNGTEPPGSTGEICDLGFENIPFIYYEDFRPEPNPVQKFRRAAHKASTDRAYVSDFEKVIEAMKCLPNDHPHSFEMQRKLHCAYCDGGMFQMPVPGGPSKKFRYKVHNSWLFAPFHRWYIYFFEKIGGKLINKPDFALPYWAWDVEEGMTIPAMFNKCDSPLNNPKRSDVHRYNTVDFNTFWVDDPEETVVQDNYTFLKKNIVDVTDKKLFFGGEYMAGEEAPGASSAGTLEVAHNSMHAWVGGDMGRYHSAGYDPLFYSHHANVDRMWDLWTTLKDGRGRPRKDYFLPEYLEASFYFWDENEKPVRVWVKDCLDNEALGITYETINTDAWLPAC